MQGGYIAWYRPTQEYLFTLILTRTQLRREIWMNDRLLGTFLNSKATRNGHALFPL